MSRRDFEQWFATMGSSIADYDYYADFAKARWDFTSLLTRHIIKERKLS